MKRWITPLATIAGTSVLLATASGQEAPAQTQGDAGHPSGPQAQQSTTDNKQAPAAAQKGDAKKPDAAKADAADDSEPKPLLNSVSLGYNTWNSGGNRNGMFQNRFVQGGFVLDDLSLMNPYSHDNFTAFELSGVPGDDFAARLKSQWGAFTSMTVRASQYSYWDPSFGNLNPSRDKAFSATLNQKIAQNFGAFATYEFEQDDHSFTAPLTSPNYNTKTVAFGGQKEYKENTVGATFSETRYTDLGQVQPNTLTDRAELNYAGNFGDRFSAAGTYAVSRIQQQGLPDSWVRDYAVSGVYDVTETSSLGVELGQTILDLNAVQNAYVRKKVSSGMNLDSQLGPWALAMGFGHREEERVRADHSYVDVPAWNSYDLKLNRRIAKLYRLGITGSVDDLTSAPVFLTDDPTLLYWDKKAELQGKISGGNEVTAGYLSYTYRYRRNADRDLSLTWYSLALGGSRVFTPKLLGYAEFSSDKYSAGGASALDSELGTYFPSSETFTVGADFTKNVRESLSAVITSFYTEDQWGQQIALSYRRDLGNDRSFQITYSPWLQRDRLYDVDSFDARILTMKFATRF